MKLPVWKSSVTKTPSSKLSEMAGLPLERWFKMRTAHLNHRLKVLQAKAKMRKCLREQLGDRGLELRIQPDPVVPNPSLMPFQSRPHTTEWVFSISAQMTRGPERRLGHRTHQICRRRRAKSAKFKMNITHKTSIMTLSPLNLTGPDFFPLVRR